MFYKISKTDKSNWKIGEKSMVASVGSSTGINLGKDWQKVDLGPLDMANLQAKSNPASLTFEEKLYGVKKKNHTWLKWLAGIAAATAAVVIGAKKWGTKIDPTNAKGWGKNVQAASQKISDGYDNIIKWFKGKWNGTAKATEETGDKLADAATDATNTAT